MARFIEKPQFAGEHGRQVGEGWINGGFFVLEPGIVDYIDDDESTKWELAPLERLAKDGELMAYRHYRVLAVHGHPAGQEPAGDACGTTASRPGPSDVRVLITGHDGYIGSVSSRRWCVTRVTT